MKLEKIDVLNKPYRIFAEHLESGAIEQFIAVMQHDAIVQGALMPDAHQGYSLPIGGVVAAQGMIFPAYIGYDIGCGMGALPTKLNAADVETHAQDIFSEIYKVVPVGHDVNDSSHSVSCKLDERDLCDLGKIAFDKRKGFLHIGTLGGGNHFIEIGKDEKNVVWVIVHSGSRGVGHGIATEYMRLAGGGKAREGNHGFDVTSDEGKAYINDMNWGLEFALANRAEILKRTMIAVNRHCGGDAEWEKLINRNHNHAEFKNGVWIHRKGATHAEAGMMGVIPGNMRDGSFIVEGKGNPDSLFSSSHGAGRVLGRKQAKTTLDTEQFKAEMAGIVAKVEAETLDESPMAYKDIFDVMRLQADLVEVKCHVKPILNIKG